MPIKQLYHADRVTEGHPYAHRALEFALHFLSCGKQKAEEKRELDNFFRRLEKPPI